MIKAAIQKGITNIKSFIQKRKTYLQNLYINHPKWKANSILFGWLSLIGFCSLLLFLLLIRIGIFGRMPSNKEIKNIRPYQTSKVFGADGVLLGEYYLENRTSVPHDQISPFVIKALVATEDARFYEHSGVDFRSWGRVFFKTVLKSDESSGGGSTITQQLVKNLYPRKKYWIASLVVNKIQEIILALRIESVYSKKDILALYLNTVSFSENLYGINVASKRFFNSNPKDIKPEEAAMLVGMLKATAYYNPTRFKDRAKERRNLVLDRVVKFGDLDKNVADSLKKLDLKLQYTKITYHHTVGLATYFREHLRIELDSVLKAQEKVDGNSYDLYKDGLKIYTTIDSKMQQYAEESVKESLIKIQESFNKNWENRKDELPWTDNKFLIEQVQKSERFKSLAAKGLTPAQIMLEFGKPTKMTVYTPTGEVDRTMSPMDSVKYYFQLLNAGLLVVHPHTGEVMAWVGGSDYKYFKYDHIKSKRQVGSIFKPILYATAIENGYDPCEHLPNKKKKFSEYDDWEPENVDKSYGGYYSMEGAMIESVNCVAVEMILRIGPQSVADMAKKMGIKGEILPVPAISLGSVDASLLEMVQVFSTFSNRGVNIKPHYISKIENANGEIIVDNTKTNFSTQLLSERTADIMQRILEYVIVYGTGSGLRSRHGLMNQIAGKTGTSQNNADGWFVAFMPNLMAGAWVGASSPAVHFYDSQAGQGARTALPIWGNFMQKLLNDKKYRNLFEEKFTPIPDTLYEVLNCPRKVWSLSTWQDDIYADSLYEDIELDSMGNPINTPQGYNPSDTIIKSNESVPTNENDKKPTPIEKQPVGTIPGRDTLRIKNNY